MSIDVPTAFISWGSLIGFVVMAVSVVWFQWKNQGTKLLREQVGDMTNRIKFLEDELIQLKNDNRRLEDDYREMKFKKNYLKQLVIEALSAKKGIDEGLLQEISSSITLKTKGSN